jgi:hypothetical protein
VAIVHSAVDQKNSFGVGKKETNMAVAFLRWVTKRRVTAIPEIPRLNNCVVFVLTRCAGQDNSICWMPKN